jgi:hyperosmotically inducible periplasmic protein
MLKSQDYGGFTLKAVPVQNIIIYWRPPSGGFPILGCFVRFSGENPMRCTAFGSVVPDPLRRYADMCNPYKNIYTMKTYLRILSIPIAVLMGTGAIVLSTGCSGTATRESTGEYIDNSAITAKVKAALAKDEVVKARQVNVDSFRGVVQLSGFVDNATEKERAGQIAAGIQGVKEVRNNITVK